MSTTKLQKFDQLIRNVRADGKLTYAEANQVAHAALQGTLKRGELEAMHDLFDHPPQNVESAKALGDAAAGGQAMTQVMYWGMPRHLSGTRGSGQTFGENVSMSSKEYFLNQRPENPLSMAVHGTAKRSYSLSFKIAEQPVRVAIPKGSTPAQTAKRIADAINQNAGAIVKSAAWDNKKAMHWPDSDAYLTGIHASAKGGTVLISPQVDS